MPPSPVTLDWPAIGGRIAHYRHARHWRQRDLATVTGLAIDTIKHLEAGRRTGYSVKTLVVIAHALEVEVGMLLWGETPSEHPATLSSVRH